MKISRKEYISRIWIYKERRKKYVSNYKGSGPVSSTDSYKLLTKRISQWTKEIKRLDKRKEKIQCIVDSVNNYFDVDIVTRSTNSRVVLARKIYFKIGLELGIRGTHLARQIRRRSNDIASYSRITLTKSFKTNPENKEAFHNFKNYFKIKSK